jgi:alkanesulfonate monooxygenase SsuD/methylene tetrahydromethanopterin reductase-like flavin-dependent oxidoreductase (luciferase family)
MTIRLGAGLLTCQRYPGNDQTDADIYRDALRTATDAERFGLDSIWVSEHHFVDDCYLPSVFALCAAIAATTTRIAIGTALLLAPLHDALRTAEDAAVVDLISRGRLLLGVGLGWRQEEFDGLGVPTSRRVARLEATITTLRAAFSGVPISDRGGVVVTPRPATPDGPPIWIGARADPAVRRAGRIADGFMATDVTPASFAAQVAIVRAELERVGRDPAGFTWSLHLPVFAWDGPVEEAYRIVRPYHNYIAWKYDDMDTARGRTGPPAPPPPISADEDQLLRDGIIVGRPADVAAAIRRFADAAGGDLHFIARCVFPGIDPDTQRETLRLVGEAVKPLVTAS